MRNHQARPPRPLLRLGWLALLVSCSPLWAAQFLSFKAVPRSGGAEVVAAGKVVMRLRSGMRINGGAAALAAELNRLAFGGLKASDLDLRTAPAGAQILAFGKPLLTIDQETARLGGGTPAGLAASWLANLKVALAAPYLVLQPRDRLPVPLGETRQWRWGGTAAVDLSFTTAAPEIAGVQLADDESALIVTGVAPGSTTLTATMDGDSAQISVDVRAWAVRVATPVVAEITSPPLPADDLRRTLRNAVLNALRPAPGARVQLGEPRAGNGGHLVSLTATGEGCFEVNRSVPVTLKTVPALSPRVLELLVSNLPERITEPSALLRERLMGQSPVRLLWHHVNSAGRPLRFVVRLVNRGDKAARIHLTESASGPHDDEIFVGHQAMMRYLALVEQGEGYILSVPAGRMLDLYDVRLPVETIISGLARIVPLEAADLLVEVAAEDYWPADAYFLAVPQRLRNDPPLTPYRWEAEKEVSLTYEVGGPWTFFHIGKEGSVNLQGQKLYGDYGVGYTIGMKCTNPTVEAARCIVSLRAGGGVARVSYHLNGALLESGLLRAMNEEIIQRFELAPGAERVLKMRTIPESGSNYPITVTIRKM